jgi:hypothetical protein
MDKIIVDSRLRSIMIEIDQRASKGIIEETFLSAGFEELDREQKPGNKICNVLYVRTT